MPSLYIKKANQYVKVLDDKEKGVRRTEHGIELLDQKLADRMDLSEGLWLMKILPGCKSLGVVTKIAEIPAHPYDYTALMSKRDELADFMVKFKREYAKKNPHPSADKGYTYSPSESEMAQAILDFFAEKSGLGNLGKRDEHRRLDPDL